MSIYNKNAHRNITPYYYHILCILYDYKKDNYDKDDLYENKIADHQQDISDKITV